MFISNETDLFVSTLCLIVGMSSAALIGCSFCCYRKCCVNQKPDPLLRRENIDYIDGIDNQNFALNPSYAQQMINPPTAPPFEFGYIPRAKSPPPSYREAVPYQHPQLYPNIQTNQAQTRF